MKLCKMIEIYLKYDNMHTMGVINVFICINNHVNSCINACYHLSLLVTDNRQFHALISCILYI